MALLRKIAGYIDTRDILVFGGFFSVMHGLHAIYPPLAWILGGTFCLWIGFYK